MKELYSTSSFKGISPHNTRVVVGMSGGVDSSVSALLLKQQGFDVSGLFMKNWNEDDGTEYCTAATDLLDAAAVCHKLDIELHTVNFAKDYWDNVFEHFLQEYRAGRTPNPDILCNREIKFKVFMDHAETLGADFIATGHYARVSHQGDGSGLYKGLDPNKDQSYFLHAVSHKQFEKTLFPIGELEKPKVRQLAEEHDLITHNKKDSTGICFIGERRFKDFLETYLPAQPGLIVTEGGKVIGEHQGLMYHTIGQRQGLGIGGVPGTPEAPWYVAHKNLKENQLVVVQGTQHPLLYAQSLKASQIHWISGQSPNLSNITLRAKTRYRQADQECTAKFTSSNEELIVDFSQPQRAITPGQSVVFYNGDQCLGGAVIEQALT